MEKLLKLIMLYGETISVDGKDVFVLHEESFKPFSEAVVSTIDEEVTILKKKLL